MRHLLLPALAALGLAAVLFPPKASAQDPYADYNVSPAYRRFLTSPYSFRTYSYLGSGRTWSYQTPLESGWFQQSPSYYHEEISPAARWSYQGPSRVEGYVAPRVLYAPPWAAPSPYPPLP